jgi:hypothetical protein
VGEVVPIRPKPKPPVLPRISDGIDAIPFGERSLLDKYLDAAGIKLPPPWHSGDRSDET